MSETTFASYADNNTPYFASDEVNYVIKILENDSIQSFEWFSDK